MLDTCVLNIAMCISFLVFFRCASAAVVGVGDHSIIVYRVFANNSNTRVVLATIKVPKLPYIHSFTVTEHYVVLAAAPLTWE